MCVCYHTRVVIYAEVDLFRRLEQGTQEAHSSLVHLF